MTVEIRPLTQITLEDIDRIMPGYIADAKYVVTRQTVPDCFAITLTLTPLETPYVRRWEYRVAGDIDRYQTIMQAGMSLGAYDGDLLVALAICDRQDWNNTFWIWEFGVHEAYRLQGIGRRMMDTLEETARSANCRVMLAETQTTNINAIRFYRAAGFEIDGVDVSYYTNQDLDSGEVAIFMKRRLTP